MASRNGIKCRMIFIAALFLFELFVFTIPCVQKIIGYNNPDVVEDIHSSNFVEGNIVSIPFDCVLPGNVTRPQTTYNESFFVLKFRDEQFVYVCIPNGDRDFWSGINYFDIPSNAVGFRAEQPYKFIGTVKRIDDSLRKQMLERMNYMVLESSKMINTQDNTNLEYYIDLLIVRNENLYLIIEIMVHIVLIILFILTIRRYKLFLWEEQVEEEKIR